jgi:hypothetical protein
MNTRKYAAEAIGGVLGGEIYRWLSDTPEGVVEGKLQAGRRNDGRTMLPQAAPLR